MRLDGAGLPAKTRPAKSKREPWQAQRNPSSALRAGMHPKWVHSPTATRYSGLMERFWFLQYSGCRLLSESGSERPASGLERAAVISGERRRSQTGLRRQVTVRSWPGVMSPTSTATGAPAAWVLRLGRIPATKGAVAATAPAPPTAEVMPSKARRRPDSSGASAFRGKVFATDGVRPGAAYCSPPLARLRMTIG